MEIAIAMLRGLPVLARDGVAGKLKDFYLDSGWAVQELVVERSAAAHWPLAVPVERVTGITLEPPAVTLDEALAEVARHTRIAPTRRSARAILGYEVHSSDAPLGRVEDVLVDTQGWRVSALRVRTRAPLARSLAVPSRAVASLSLPERRLTLRLESERVLRFA